MKTRTRFCLLLAAATALSVLVSCHADSGPADMEWDELVSPHRHYMEREGYRLQYIDIGEGDPVFMLHGFASNSYCWFKMVPYLLGAGHRLILVDLPGQGLTEVPPESFDPTIENVAAEVIGLADSLGIESFAAVGASMGGGLTLYLCHAYPDRISRAVVIDPASFPQEKPWFLGLMEIPGVKSFLQAISGPWTVKMALSDTVYVKEVIDDKFVGEYSRPLAKPGYVAFVPRLLDRFFSPTGYAMVDHYGEIRVPLLIVWGLQDTWVPPEFGPRLNALVPGSRFVGVEGSGHMPHLEKPEITGPVLVDFLATPKEEPATQPAIAEPAPLE